MENIIQSVSIKNFKSIKNLEFDCKKVNVFIGKPNVGKSNILEALSLFALPMAGSHDINKFVRMKTMKNLFYDNNPAQDLSIKINMPQKGELWATVREQDKNDYEFFIGDNEEFANIKYDIQKYYSSLPEKLKPLSFRGSFTSHGDMNGYSIISEYQNSIKNYSFERHDLFTLDNNMPLLPPDGRNLVSVIQHNNDLFEEVQDFFQEYGLEMLMDVEKNEFEIQKKIDRRVYKYPFELVAETLQRIIFYLAAIESNHNTAIIFEEPEAHSFPPYITTLAKRFSMDETNQFFISTHSPYLLLSLIEDNSIEMMNIFITYYEDYETKLKLLSKPDLQTILDNYIDVFFNLDRFLLEDK